MSKLNKRKLLERLKDWREEKYSTFYTQWKDKDERAYQQIKEMIQKPEVTEEWYNEKVNEMEQVTIPIGSRKKDRKDFIRKLVKEIQGEK